MKKIFSILVASVLGMFILTGCVGVGGRSLPFGMYDFGDSNNLNGSSFDNDSVFDLFADDDDDDNGGGGGSP